MSLDAEARYQIRTTPDLLELARTLGFDIERSARARELMDAIEASVHVEVADVAALQAAVATARSLAARAGASVDAAGRELLDRIAAAGTDRRAILDLLDRKALRAPLAFVEQIPVVRRGGETAWLTPVDGALVRRRPADFDSFERLVRELDALFLEPERQTHEALRLEVRQALDRVLRDARRENAYLPTALTALDRRLREIESRGATPSAAARLTYLEGFLQRLIDVERGVANGPTPDAKTVTGLASEYAATRAVQVPSVSHRVVALLLAPPYVSVTRWFRRRRFLRALDLLRQEVARGHYDGVEVARRLQRLEADGAFFSSLVYTLLRLSPSHAMTRVPLPKQAH